MKEKKLSNKKTNHAITMVIIYAVLILITAAMLIPFIWIDRKSVV